LQRRWQGADFTNYDIPDLAGYNIDGTLRYLDRDAFHALVDPAYAEHLGVGPIDTGMSPDGPGSTRPGATPRRPLGSRAVTPSRCRGASGAGDQPESRQGDWPRHSIQVAYPRRRG
jgi:hypothetical protein